MNARTLLRLFSSMVLLSVSAPALSNPQAPDETEKRVVVKRGDTLVKLAKRHQVTVDDLREWNAHTLGRRDQIRVGHSLVVRPGSSQAASTPSAGGQSASLGFTQAVHSPRSGEDWSRAWEDYIMVRRGDTLMKLARRHKVEVQDLMGWNGLGEKFKLKSGDRLKILRPGPRPAAQSVGRVSDGSLVNPVYLGPGEGYRLRFPKNAYTVAGVAQTLKACAKETHQRYPGSHTIFIGDISRPGGGRFPPHGSHQSGRDVDIGYYLASGETKETMVRVKRHEVDYKRSWHLLNCMIERDEVVRVFIDRDLQHGYIDYLRRQGLVEERELKRLFSVLGAENALVRHAKDHDHHLHVRFGCDSDQLQCYDGEKEKRFRYGEVDEEDSEENAEEP